jgi:hypothetical protein
MFPVKPTRYPNAADRSAGSFPHQPLSRNQKAELSMLARSAWEKFQRPGDEHQWRHEQAAKACGKRISQASQRDYLPIRAHFRDLLGQSDRAFRDLMAVDTEPQRIAMAKLRHECTARKLPLDYPAAICRKQFRCSLAQATAKQLWCLIFTIRNRRKVFQQCPKVAKEHIPF